MVEFCRRTDATVGGLVELLEEEAGGLLEAPDFLTVLLRLWEYSLFVGRPFQRAGTFPLNAPAAKY